MGNKFYDDNSERQQFIVKIVMFRENLFSYYFFNSNVFIN